MTMLDREAITALQAPYRRSLAQPRKKAISASLSLSGAEERIVVKTKIQILSVSTASQYSTIRVLS